MWWGQVKCTPPRYCDVGVVHSLQVVPCGEVKSSVHLLDIVMLMLSIHCKLWWGQVKCTPPRYCDVGVVHSLQLVPCGEVKSSVHLDIVMLELSIHCKLSHVVRSSSVILWCWSCPFIASCPMWWGQVKCTPPRYCDVGVVHSLQVVPCGEVKSSVHLDIVMLELSIHCKLILWCSSVHLLDIGVVHSLQVVPCGEVKSSVHLLDIVMLELSIHCKLSHVVRSSQVYTS